MPRYLLAAEVDKIQDFIFRAAKLREVVGGSRLLARFCKEGVDALKEKYDNKPEIIISDGGAFRLVFEDEDKEKAKTKAKEFGNDLAELYRRCAGGTLTIAEPVEYDEAKFKECNDTAQVELRKAKNRGDNAATAVHLPYIAFCASCGVAIAAEHSSKLSTEPARENYLCVDCRYKTEEKFDKDKLFVGAFYESLRTELKKLGEEILLPEKFKLNQRDWVDVICKADSRNYVAYLVADGNGMGELFSECNKQQLKNLSEQLTVALRESLAKPCALMLANQEKIQELKQLPVVPLILGGDDLFALLPAPFALDFARAFCFAYEENIATALKKPEINLPVDKKPTIAAAVVICKSSYPHTLAHQRAEAALKQAKEMARRIEFHENKRVSTINFDIVTGNQVIADKADDKNEYRATLRPYFISDNASEWGIDIENLLEARVNLKSLPGKRRAEFERLYADLPNDDRTQEWQSWRKEFNQLRKRLKREDEAKFTAALEKLGDAKQGANCYLRGVKRALSIHWHGHGLPDLLEAWDFAYKLEKPMNEYEEE